MLAVLLAICIISIVVAMKYDITTLGGAVEDITFYTPEARVIDNHQEVLCQKLLAFEYGAKIRVNAVKATFGGGAANVAVAGERMGLKTACICAVGDDERGTRILKNLHANGVATAWAQEYKGEQSTFSFVLVGPGNKHTIFSYNGAKTRLRVTKTDLAKIDTVFLHITSLSGKWRDVLKNVFAQANRYRISWNPGHVQLTDEPQLVRHYLKHTEVVLLNKDEAAELVASDTTLMRGKVKNAAFLDKIKNLVTAIHSYGPKIVVITHGKTGADAYDGVRLYHADILPEKKRVDTTGIGDAFGAGFISGLRLYDYDIERALQLGMRNAASVITKHGAQNGLLKLRKKQ